MARAGVHWTSDVEETETASSVRDRFVVTQRLWEKSFTHVPLFTKHSKLTPGKGGDQGRRK